MPSVGRADDLRPYARGQVGRKVSARARAQRDAPLEELSQGGDVVDADAAHLPLEERRAARRGREVRRRRRHRRSPLTYDERPRGEIAEALVPARGQDRDHADDVERGQEIDDTQEVAHGRG
jgi:hypothetical protein